MMGSIPTCGPRLRVRVLPFPIRPPRRPGLTPRCRAEWGHLTFQLTVTDGGGLAVHGYLCRDCLVDDDARRPLREDSRCPASIDVWVGWGDDNRPPFSGLRVAVHCLRPHCSRRTPALSGRFGIVQIPSWLFFSSPRFLTPFHFALP